MNDKNVKENITSHWNVGMKVTVIPMEAVDRAEKKAMPLRYRLLNPHKRIAVIGVKEP